MTVGERIKQTREQHDLSQVALADKIDVSKQTLYKYENNIITNIPSDKVELIAEVLNTTPTYLMGWDHSVSINSSSCDSHRSELNDVTVRTAFEIQRNNNVILEAYNNSACKERLVAYATKLMELERMENQQTKE